MTKINNYLEQTDIYCQEGEEELAKGDLREGGEKYWGGATQVLKAYCELKGWQHDGHAKLFQNVSNLCVGLGDKRLMEQFSLASSLHINFYEGWFTKEQVEEHAEQTKEFITKIKGLIKVENREREENK